MIDSGEKRFWMGFNVFEGIGPLRFKLLLDFFGTAKKAYEASGEELRRIGLGEKLVGKFEEFRKNFDPDLYLVRVSKLGIEILTFDDKNYPEVLKEIPDPPPVVYVKTNNLKKIFQKKAVAVVGTRLPTAYGRKATEMIVEGLIASGLVVVSGLARGVDKIAHETTLNNGGLTIGVLGCGLDKVYPPEHKGLVEKIIENGGAVISEFPLGMDAVPGNFPARNRIISGLSLGVVITEAAKDSGSLITASHAAEQGREVFAVPGPITSPMSKGTAELIKKGAKLVSEVGDILEELQVKSYKGAEPRSLKENENLSEEERRIVTILKDEDLNIDEIIRKTGLESGRIGSLLSLMEIRGLIKSYNGIYSLK